MIISFFFMLSIYRCAGSASCRPVHSLDLISKSHTVDFHIMNKIVSFSPFHAIYDASEDFITNHYYFKCSCGSVSCVKLDNLDKLSFFSGNYMCLKCGMSVLQKQELNYYHPFFIRKEVCKSIFEPSLFD